MATNEQIAVPTIPLVDLRAQYETIREEVDAAVAGVIGAGKFIGGETVNVFSRDFAKYCQAGYCVPCANGTDAIELALAALGIGKGDEVIIPAFSFAATLEAVCNAGATPVLCDIDPARYTLDPAKALAGVTPATKAIMPVHLYGQTADMDPLVAFAREHGIFIIEDAAQAHGALYKGRMAGSIGDMATFSFFPAKNLGAYGDAGAITTSSEELYKLSWKLANHGRVTKYEHDVIGRNSRLDTLQAAVLSVKLKYLDEWTEKRRRLAAGYNALLQDIAHLQLPALFPDSLPAWHLYVVRIPAGTRSSLRTWLQSQGIETGIHYPVALSSLKATVDQLGIRADCPEAGKAASEVLSLPLYPELTSGQQDYICDRLRHFFQQQA